MDHVATIVTTMPILVVVVDRIINKSPVSAPKMVSDIGAFIRLIPDLIFKDGKQMKKSPSNEKKTEGDTMGSTVAVGSTGFQHIRVVLFEDIDNFGLGFRFRGNFIPEADCGCFDTGPFLIRD